MVSEYFKKVIKDYLDDFSKQNEAFAIKYANDKKNIEECCNFIVGEVKKMNVNGLADDEVYQLARHYYDEDNLEIKATSANVVINHTIELTEEEKKKAHEKALADYQESELKKLKVAQDKAEKKEKAKQEKAQKQAKESNQMSLFDFMGE